MSGEVNVRTELASFLTLTEQTPERAKTRLLELWPEYEAKVLEHQKVLWDADPQYGIATNEASTMKEKIKASNALDAIRRELRNRCGWRDS